MQGDGRILNGEHVEIQGEVGDQVGVLVDLQSVFGSDVDEVLRSTVEISDLSFKRSDLGLAEDSQKGSKHCSNRPQESFVPFL